jgi:hypothetical protein
MKKFYLLAVIAIIAFIAIPALAFAAPANKVTGNVTRMRTGDQKESTFVFNAFEAQGVRPVKGQITIEGINYDVYLEINVEFVQVNSNGTAYFGGKTVVSNVSNPAVNDYAMFYVVDAGEPGIGQDSVFSTTGNYDAFSKWISNPTSDGMNQYDVIEGNLQVHYYGD